MGRSLPAELGERDLVSEMPDCGPDVGDCIRRESANGKPAKVVALFGFGVRWFPLPVGRDEEEIDSLRVGGISVHHVG